MRRLSVAFPLLLALLLGLVATGLAPVRACGGVSEPVSKPTSRYLPRCPDSETAGAGPRHDRDRRAVLTPTSRIVVRGSCPVAKYSAAQEAVSLSPSSSARRPLGRRTGAPTDVCRRRTGRLFQADGRRGT